MNRQKRKVNKRRVELPHATALKMQVSAESRHARDAAAFRAALEEPAGMDFKHVMTAVCKDRTNLYSSPLSGRQGK